MVQRNNKCKDKSEMFGENKNENQKKGLRKKAKPERVVIFDENFAKNCEESFEVNISDRGHKNCEKVYFPYPPYEEQTHFIASLIEAVKCSKNVLIESPTGTGKTLCTLVGVLGALAIPKNQFQKQRKQKYNHKVFYLTRTHSQITQVMNELKRIPWYKLKANIIASREQLCINKNLSQLKGRQLDKGCQEMCQQKLCKFKEDMCDKNTSKLMKQLLSIDEIKEKCSKNFCCPFYLSKSATEQAQVTIMPFNYLLDWKMFEKNKFQIRNSVIIFDEAHNVDVLAEEGSSLALDTELLHQSIMELKSLEQATKCRYLLKKFEEEQEDISGGCLGQVINFTLTMRNRLKSHQGNEVIFTNFHDIISSLKSMTAFTHPKTQENYEGIDPSNYGQMMFSFERVLKIFSAKNIACEQTSNLSDVLKKIFHLLDLQPSRVQEDYYVSISVSGPQTVVFKFNCLNAGLCFERLQKQMPRSIILCSGTLGPFDLLENELNMKFPVKIQVSSFVKDHQISSKVLSKFENEQTKKIQQYDFSFQKKCRPEQYEHLSRELHRLEKIVPNGIVVAFSTYELMDKMMKNCMNLSKKIFYESKSAKSEALFKQFSKEATKNGAFLFIIMKGRLAEGINFCDELCRCLILVGIPFLPINQCRVSKKKQLIERNNGREAAQKWYMCQTFKTVNQVIGRVLRSKKDYGSILFIDQRYGRKEILQNLPKWLQASINNCDPSKPYLKQFQQFFLSEPWAKVPQISSKRSNSTNSFEKHLQRTTIVKNQNSPTFSALLRKQTPVIRKNEKAKKKLQISGDSSSEEDDKSCRKFQNESCFSALNDNVVSEYKSSYPWLSIDFFIGEQLMRKIEQEQKITGSDDQQVRGINEELEVQGPTELIPKRRKRQLF